MPDWYDNEAFWEDTESVIFNKERRQKAAEEVEHALALVQLRPGAAVLDLGCGVGRHSLELARKGYRVTGVDRTAMYLAKAKAAAAGQALNVEWVHADMRDFVRKGAFDAAINLLTSFGYFTDLADDRRVLDNVFAGLKPGGHLVIDLMGREVLARIFRQYDWHEEPDGTLLLEERTLKEDWTWLDMRWIIIRGGERRDHRFRLRLYSGAELKALLADAGFAKINLYGSLSGTPYDHQAERLVVVAQKL